MYQKLFQIQWTNKAKQFREHCQHFVSHSFKALRTLLTKHPAKRNYKEPTRFETNSQNALSKTTRNWKHARNLGNELQDTWNEHQKNGRRNLRGSDMSKLCKDHIRPVSKEDTGRDLLWKNKPCSSRRQFWVSIEIMRQMVEINAARN